MQLFARSTRFASGLALGALIACIGLVAGCNNAADAAADAALRQATGNDVAVQREGDTMTVQTGDAGITVATAGEGTSVALPAEFPGDVFLPPQRAVNSAMDMAGMKMVNLTTPSQPAEVAADVEEAMQAAGWKREMAMQANGSSTLVYTKDKRQTIYQMMNSDGGGTQIAIRAGGE